MTLPRINRQLMLFRKLRHSLRSPPKHHRQCNRIWVSSLPCRIRSPSRRHPKSSLDARKPSFLLCFEVSSRGSAYQGASPDIESWNSGVWLVSVRDERSDAPVQVAQASLSIFCDRCISAARYLPELYVSCEREAIGISSLRIIE